MLAHSQFANKKEGIFFLDFILAKSRDKETSSEYMYILLLISVLPITMYALMTFDHPKFIGKICERA